MHCYLYRDTSSFIGTVYSNSFYLKINIPTRIKNTSKTLGLLDLQTIEILLDAFRSVMIISKRKENYHFNENHRQHMQKIVQSKTIKLVQEKHKIFKN